MECGKEINAYKYSICSPMSPNHAARQGHVLANEGCVKMTYVTSV